MQLYSQARDILRTVYGAEHPEVAGTLSNMGLVAENQVTPTRSSQSDQ